MLPRSMFFYGRRPPATATTTATTATASIPITTVVQGRVFNVDLNTDEPTDAMEQQMSKSRLCQKTLTSRTE
ncbi:hypothetical protein BC941DRAFT_475558 [Chlamydoabsidia padenii]|nr:hypothetical protein BC941DRAFT_475558 [Chlamydoabsidia padenii]